MVFDQEQHSHTTVTPRSLPVRITGEYNLFRWLNWENRTENFLPIKKILSALLITFYYAQKYHKNYNICYKNYPTKVGKFAKTKVMVVDNTPINVNNVLLENVEAYV